MRTTPTFYLIEVSELGEEHVIDCADCIDTLFLRDFDEFLSYIVRRGSVRPRENSDLAAFGGCHAITARHWLSAHPDYDGRAGDNAWCRLLRL